MSYQFSNFEEEVTGLLTLDSVGKRFVESAKRYARFLGPHMKKSKLSERQEIIARAAGFPDWHAFHTVAKKLISQAEPPSVVMPELASAWPLLIRLEDDDTLDDEFFEYLVEWSANLAEHSGLPQAVTMDVIARMLGSDDWEAFTMDRDDLDSDDWGEIDEEDPSSPFRIVFALSVVVDFRKVVAGLAAPPWVNHDKVDFERLAGLLIGTFKHSPRVSLGVANDTIDAVTFEHRLGLQGVSTGDPRMADFGQKLLQVTPRPMPSVVDVRTAWRPLHHLPDRRFSPPPMMIVFIVEAPDPEDAMIWFRGSSMILGRDIMSSMLSGKAPGEADQEGNLPEKLQTGLASIFGCEFETPAMLNHIAWDKLPSWLASGMSQG